AGVTYTQNEVGTQIYTGSDGKTYRLNGTTMEEYDTTSGAVVAGGKTATVGAGEEIKKTEYTQGAALSGVKLSSDALTELKTASGLTDDAIAALTSNISKVNSFEAVSDTVLQTDDPYTRANIAQAIKDAYANGGAAGVTAKTNTFANVIDENNKNISGYDEADGTHVDGYKKIMNKHSALADIAKMTAGSTEQQHAINNFVNQVEAAEENLDYLQANSNSDAKKVDGQDAIINLNGIEYTGSSNAFSINGLTITAQAVTGPDERDAITITTQSDTQGMYDKVKDFLTQYNALINEITSLYNAASAKGYEPLTDEEKDAMSDTEIEKWEEKIKSSLLRRDDSLESIMNAMTSSMSKGVKVNGKTYHLSSFGIKTLGYLNAAENEQYAYHIDGDEDDASVSGNSDKLMKALTEEPDTVIEFMQGLTNNLYQTMGKKMQSTTLSSVYKVYNDKEMASEYSDYTDIIKKWEEKLQAQEDYYYQKFSAMETALSKLQSQTSSMSNLFGG
ncbi:MAG: flagellar filament capping protein FliD, partial [Thermoflexaceae bacterium]|nr:flagellar filament capping protein FliD [Thermoflexaceae bacterium]